jgi:hypothetical protein
MPSSNERLYKVQQREQIGKCAAGNLPSVKRGYDVSIRKSRSGGSSFIKEKPMKRLFEGFSEWWAKRAEARADSEEYARAQARGAEWFASQKQAVQAGEEIEPPWKVAPALGPTSSAWRQGGGEAWIKEIWYPFWTGLNKEQRITYLDTWDAPDNWREYIDPGSPKPRLAEIDRDPPAAHVLNLWLMDTDREVASSEEPERKPDNT